MNFVLLTALGLLLVATLTRYSAHRLSTVEYPFMLCLVIAGWVLPQLTGLYITGAVPPDALGKALFYVILCLLFGIGGYNATRKTYKMANWQYSQTKLQFAAAALMLAGAFFYFRVSELAAEATQSYGGFWTGTITIYVFLSSMLTVGFVLAIGANIQKATFLNRAMITFGLFIYLQRILIYGRREEAVELFLIAGLYIWRKYGWVPNQLLVFGTFAVGTLFIFSVGNYRSIMIAQESYSWSGASLTQILDINFWDLFKSGFTDPLKNQELKNAALSISAADIRFEFNGGLSIWNQFVLAFIPGQIVGHDVKQNMLFSLPNLAYEEFHHIPWPGTTNTGFADSFLSFWFFGAFVFFAIGSIMRNWFISAERGSLTALMIMMLISIKSLMAITHNSYDFFLFFVNVVIFLFPALLFARKSRTRNV